MGRGNNASGILFGPPAPRSNSTASEAELLEDQFRELLVGLRRQSSPEARRQLLAFLRQEQLPPGDPEFDDLDTYAVRLADELAYEEDEHPDEPYFFGTSMGQERRHFHLEAAVILARASHRIEPSCLNELLEKYLHASLRQGDGYDYMIDRLDNLHKQPSVEPREKRPVLSPMQGIMTHYQHFLTHYQHAEKANHPACKELDAEVGVEFLISSYTAVPSCKACQGKAKADPGSIAGDFQTRTEKLAEAASDLVAHASKHLTEAQDLGRRPLELDEYQDQIERGLWAGWSYVLIDRLRQEQGIELDDAQVDELLGFWVPDKTHLRSLPKIVV